MNYLLAVISEAIVHVFNILILIRMTELKRDNWTIRAIIYAGIVLFSGIFGFTAYNKIMTDTVASFVCVTIPSAILFFTLSKYKDLRFFVTFCFLNTVTEIISFFFGMISVVVDSTTIVFLCEAMLCFTMALLYFAGRNYFRQYRKLLKNVKDGWGVMAISAFLIYAFLILDASYPKPLLERPEHFFVHALLSVTVLSFYAVIVILLLQKRNFAELSDRFNEEKQWHKIAHVDALTGMKNRMAYMEMLERLEHISRSKDQLYAIMIDINNFKKINDTYGHYAGDTALKKAAEFLNEVFAGNDFMIFRVGGDEFAIISLNAELDLIEEAFLKLRQYDFGYDLNCSFSIGYSMVDPAGNNAFENAFIRADKMMYADKIKIKQKL